ncbi:MAG TPA: phosphosulfolactate synthase [Nitrososphaerales archaeon]|nr:phosphosulfolactate synthase [Nitrososphaerales archaeon]
MSARLLEELGVTERGGKPRNTGLTIAIDEFKPLDWDLLAEASGYVDYTKIALSTPLMVERSKILERVRRYHDLGVRVLSSGTLMDVAVRKNAVPQITRGLKDLGFDAVGVRWPERDGAPAGAKGGVLREISNQSMEPVLEVGDARTGTSPALAAIRQATGVKGSRVIVAVPFTGQGRGQESINWEALNEIAGTFGPPNLVLEALLQPALVQLVLEFGPEVNLSGVPIDEALSLEMHRLGLTTETLGTSRQVQSVEGPPAAKFVYHLIRAEHPIDQGTLILRSGLPRRTVQGAIRFLVEKGLIREVADASDMRRHRYTPS